MFKEVSVFSFTDCIPPEQWDEKAFNDLLGDKTYEGVPPTHRYACGFVSPLPEHIEERPMAYPVMGRRVMKFREGERKPKPAEVNQLVGEKVAEIEKAQARTIKGKERDVIRDEVLLELLPKTFPDERDTLFYINPAKGLLIVASKTDQRAEAIGSLLRSVFGSMPITRPNVVKAPPAVITDWLRHNELRPAGFVVGDKATFVSDESGTVSISGDDPAGETSEGFLDAGYRCEKLRINYFEEGEHLCTLELDKDLHLYGIKQEGVIGERIDNSREAFSLEHEEEGVDPAMLALNADFMLIASLIEDIWTRYIEALGGHETPPVTW